MLNQNQIDVATRMWAEDAKTQDICAAIKITPRKFESYRATCLSGLETRRKGTNGAKWLRKVAPPTLAEIAERAAEIRAGWSHETEMQRRFGARGTLVEFDLSPLEKKSQTLPDILE